MQRLRTNYLGSSLAALIFSSLPQSLVSHGCKRRIVKYWETRIQFTTFFESKKLFRKHEDIFKRKIITSIAIYTGK